MSDCEFCGIVHGKTETRKLYEDEHVLVVLAGKPCASGHAQVILKRHGPFIEVPKEVLSTFFWVASFSASAIFEYLGAQGTNIILNEGIKGHEHPVLDVIPRKFDDGLDFQWAPKELSEQENTAAFEKLKDQAFFIGKEKPRQEEKKEPVPVEEKRKEITGKDDYQIRRLVRIP